MTADPPGPPPERDHEGLDTSDAALTEGDRQPASAALAARFRQADRWVMAGLAWGLVALLVYPGNVPLINDESLLLDLVWRHHQAGTLPIMGIMGTYGLPYGPLPAWCYQALLSLIGPVLPAIALGKTLLVTGWTLAAAWALATRLRWPRWPLLWLVASPYLYHYQRSLWDNVFLLPLTMTLMLVLVLWHQRRQRRYLWLAMLVGAGMGLTHLLALPMLFLLALALLLGEGRWLRQHWPTALGALVLGLALLAPYLWASWAARVQAPDYLRTGDWRDVLQGPLWGASWFSALGMGNFLPELWHGHAVLGRLAPWVGWLSTLSLPLLVLGLVHWGRSCRVGWRQLGAWPMTQTLGAWLAMQVLFLLVFHAWGQREAMPHYSHTLMPLWFMALWQGAAQARRHPWARHLPAVALLALACWTAGQAAHVQVQGGNRGWHFGSTLSTQWQLAHELQAWDPGSQLAITVPQYQEWRRTLLTVMRYSAPATPVSDLPRGVLHIGYREPDDPGSGHLRLRVLADSMPPQP